MSSTVTESTLMAMADLLEVSESESTSQEEDDFADGFVLIEDEKEKLKKSSAGRGIRQLPSKNNEHITLVGFRKAPRAGSSSLSNSGTTISPTHSQTMQHYSSSPSQQTNMSTSGCSPSKSKVNGIDVIEEYQSGDSTGSLTPKQSHRFADAAEDSKSGGTPRNKSGQRLGSSGGFSRSGSEIFSGSRSRVGESSQSLSNSGVHLRRQFVPGKTDVLDLLSSAGLYVDKSRWIHLFLQQAPRASVFLRPRQFGKTMAINSGRVYLDHLINSGKSYEMQMGRNYYNQEHAQKYSVLVIEFKKAAGLLQASKASDFKKMLKQYLSKLIFDLLKKYRKTIKDIPFEFKDRFEAICGEFPAGEMGYWEESLALLVHLANAFSARQVVLFIDDYDSVLLKAYHLKAFDSLSVFFGTLYCKLFLVDEKILFKTAIFGVHRFHDCYPFKMVNKLRYFALGDDPFALEFGFNNLTDLVFIQNHYNSKILAKEAMETFGGYPIGSTQNTQTLMSPTGLVKAFKWSRVEKSFAFEHLSIDLDGLPFIKMHSFGIGDMYKALTRKKPFKDAQMAHLDLNSHGMPPNMNVLLTFLKLEGLLNFNMAAKEMSPVNEAARLFLLNYTHQWFDQRFYAMNCWLALGELDMDTFERRITRAWNTKYFLQGLSPVQCFEPALFLSILMDSADKSGNVVEGFNDKFKLGTSKMKFDEEVDPTLLADAKDMSLVRFRTEAGIHIVLLLGWTNNNLFDKIHSDALLKTAGKYYAHLAEKAGPEHAQLSEKYQTYPKPDHFVATIFVQNRPIPIFVSSAMNLNWAICVSAQFIGWMNWRVLLVAFSVLAEPLLGWSYFFSSLRSDTPQSNTDSVLPDPDENPKISIPSNPSPIPRSTSRGQIINHPMGYQSSSPIPMQSPTGGMVRRGGSGLSFSLDRSCSDHEIVKRHSSPGVTSSFSPKGVFEATIDMRDKKPFSLEYRDVEDIFTQPYYFVDKSRFITHWLDDPAKLTFFLRPRKMGKSINCSMLARFLNCRMEPSAGFRRLLNIFREPEFSGYVRGHARKYGVIWLDWATSGLMETSNKIEFEIVLIKYIQRIVREAVESIGRPLSEIEKSAPDGVDLEDLLSTDNLGPCSKAFHALVHILNRYTENAVILLIDDFDEIYRKAAEVDAYETLDEYLVQSFDEMMRHCSSMVSKIACFGVHMLADNGPFRECTFGPSAIRVSTLGERDNYQTDFGFTQKEVMEAVECFKEEAKTDDSELEINYQVVSEGSDKIILHPYSTAAAIKFGSVDEYWTREHPLDFDNFPFTVLGRETLGLGDFFFIVHEPHSGLNWPLTPIPVSYAPEKRGFYWKQEQLLSWLHAEGYAARKQLPCQEVSLHMHRRVYAMVDQKTGLIQALKSLRSAYPLSDRDVAPFAKSFDSLLRLPHFLKGSSALHDTTRLKIMLEEILKAVFPMKSYYKSDYDVTGYPMFLVSENHLVLFVIDMRKKAPDLEKMKERLMKVWLRCEDNDAVTIIGCYLVSDVPTVKVLPAFNPEVDRFRFDLY